MSIATGILQFKQDVDDVYKAGKLDPIASSECLNGNVSGVVISVNDVSPIEHNVKCTVGSKNLLKPVFSTDDSAVNYTDGVLFVPQYGGNTLVVGSTPLYVPQNTWLYYKHTLLLGKDRLVIRLFNSNGENISTKTKTNIECTPAWYLEAYRGYIVDTPANGFSFKVTSEVAYIILCYCGMNSEGGNKYGDLQLEKGTTATPYTPYTTDFSGVEVSRYGKNLFDVPSMVTFKGVLDYKNASFLKAGVTYVFYYDAATFDTESEGIVVNVYDGGAVFLKPQQAWRVTPKIDNPRMIVYSNGFDWNQSQGTTATITNFRICIADANYLEYEPYIEPTVYTANADGTVDGIISISPNMTLLSNNGAVLINAKYYKDPDIVISNLQQAIALSGGE